MSTLSNIKYVLIDTIRAFVYQRAAVVEDGLDWIELYNNALTEIDLTIGDGNDEEFRDFEDILNDTSELIATMDAEQLDRLFGYVIKYGLTIGTQLENY